MAPAIAPWFRLRLPSCGPRFESRAHHLCFFQFVLLPFELNCERNKNKQKEAGIGLLKTSFLFLMGHIRPLFVYFRFFKQTVQFFTTNQCDKLSIQYKVCGDSNPQPLEHDSSPITTSPWLPP